MATQRSSDRHGFRFPEGSLSGSAFVDALRALPVSVAHTDRDLRYTWIYNPGRAEALENAIGRRLIDIVPGEGSQGVMELKRRVVESGQRIQIDFTAEHEDGTHSYRLSVDPLYEDGEIVGVSTVTTDLTPTVRARASLAESEERFSKAFGASPDPQVIADDKGIFVEVNRAFEDTFGFTADEVIGRTTLDLDLYPSLDQRGRLREAYEEKGFLRDYEVDLRTKSGEIVQGLVSAEPIEIDGKPFSLAIFRDITERKAAEEALRDREAELRRINEELEARVQDRTAELLQTNRQLEERNRELQSFAYVASHDMQEPLRKIQTFADLIRSDYQLPEEAAVYLDRLQMSASRMSQLLADLLAFSRITTRPEPFARVFLAEVVDGVLDDLQLAARQADAAIEVDADVEMTVDASQIRQLVNHLVMNALKYRHADRPCLVRIAGRRQEVDGRAYCEITVADNGIGFDMRYAERIFEPFERLHERGSYPGTGMGLAICRRIVHRHGGSISVESVPGEGSRFTVMLPTIGGESPIEAPGAPSGNSSGAQQTTNGSSRLSTLI